MKHSRLTDEQIIGILKEQENGLRKADVGRKLRISEATFYKYKAKFGGMEVSDARKLKALEEENAKLTKLLAETMLDNAVFKYVAAKNGDARFEVGCCRSCLREACCEPASGVRGFVH